MAITATEARQIVYRRMLDEWDDGTYGPFLLEHQAGPPSGPPARWCRVSLRNTAGGGQVTLGPAPNRRYLRVARVLVQAFANASMGRRGAEEIAQAARELFEGVTFSDIRGYDGTLREAADDPPWLVSIASINVEYDERK